MNRKLWATDIRYLNDSREFRCAIELATRHVEMERNSGAPERIQFAQKVLADLALLDTDGFRVYVISFSSQADQLSQWRGYCPPGAGLNLGFNSDDLVIVSKRQGFSLIPCLYAEDDQNRLVSELISTARNATTDVSPEKLFILLMVKWAAAIKDGGFGEENEWRLVSAQFKPLPLFRQGRSFIVPYIEMDLTNEHTPSGFKMDCLDSVTVGPTPHPELSEMAASDVLDRYGVNYGTTLRSAIPFRTW
jgi:hypothetical protein